MIINLLHYNYFFREDFDNGESSTLLNSLDVDNLTLGAEGNVLSF